MTAERGRQLAWAAALLAVLAVAGTLAFHRLGVASFLGDESIYVEPARRVAAGDVYPMRQVSGRLYISKPPLSLLVEGASMRFLGTGEIGARLPSAAAGTAVALLVFAAGAALWDVATGLLAALLLAATPSWLMVHGVRQGTMDSELTLLVSVALFLYLRYRAGGRPAWLIGACLLSAAAALVKSIFAPVELLAVALAFEAAVAVLARRTGRGHREGNGKLGPPQWWAAVALGASGAAALGAWFLDMSRRTENFGAFLRKDTLVRATSGVDPGHLHGFTYYCTVLAEDYGLWLLGLLLIGKALAPLWRGSAVQSRAALLLPLWAVVVVATLQTSASKLPWYPDTALPPLVLLLAAGITCTLRGLAPSNRPTKDGARGMRLLQAAAALAVVAGLGLHVHRAWGAVAAAAPRTEMHRLSIAFRQLPPRSVLYFDPPPTNLRAWNRIYLADMEPQVEGVPPPVPVANPAAADPGGRCVVLVTGNPETLRRPDLAAAPTLHLLSYGPQDAPLTLVDLCGGEALRRLAQVPVAQ